MDLLALALEILLLCGDLFLLLRGQLLFLTPGFFDGLGAIDDRFNVGIQGAEALDVHEGLKRILIV